MKITDIKPQVRAQDRVSVFVDKKYSFSLSLAQVEKNTLKIGQEISENQLVELKSQSDFGKTLDRVLRWLSSRPHSRYELEQYAYRKKIEPDSLTLIIEKLEGWGYLNDAEFARAFTASRRASGRNSVRKIKLELRAKGVDQDIIDQALDNGEVDDREVLKKLVEKKRQIPRYKENKKIIEFLLRKGFNYQDVREVLAEVDEEA
jgi:regulatory protein